MKLTTKRNRWFFWRELFLYMIPMILIVWTIDVFYNFMQCPLHPEWSAPCSVIWIIAAMYGISLLLVIICAIISAHILRKVKKQIENEFTATVTNHTKEEVKGGGVKEKKVKESNPNGTTLKKDKKVEKKNTENKKVSKNVTIKKTAIKK